MPARPKKQGVVKPRSQSVKQRRCSCCKATPLSGQIVNQQNYLSLLSQTATAAGAECRATNLFNYQTRGRNCTCCASPQASKVCVCCLICHTAAAPLTFTKRSVQFQAGPDLDPDRTTPDPNHNHFMSAGLLIIWFAVRSHSCIWSACQLVFWRCKIKYI